jgi:hypothetical protein
MKFSFGESKGPFVEIDVDPEITRDELKSRLINEHGFKDGNYMFICGGKFLKGEKPLKDVKERSRIVLYIKAPKKAEAPEKPVTQSQPSEAPRPAPAPPQPARQPSPQPARQPSSQPAPARPPFPGQQPTQQELMQTIIKSLNLEKLYNPENNIWDHTATLAQITEIVNTNPSHLYQIFLSHVFHGIPGTDPAYIINTILLLLDIQAADFSPCQDDIKAKEESMSKPQREIYNSLVKEFDNKDKMAIIEALENASFNKDEAIKTLKA